jgi:hypothetical protein
MKPNLIEIYARLTLPSPDWIREGAKYDMCALLNYIEQLESKVRTFESAAEMCI